jgi:hypothetical protein
MFWLMKPAGVPDTVGGLAPIDFPEVVCVNRSGGTHTFGEVVALAIPPGNAATFIATNDSNSYRPGASNDTVWNTVVDPTTNQLVSGGATTRRSTVFGVCTTRGAGVLNNAKGTYKFFGLIEQAFVIKSTGTNAAIGLAAGAPLTVTITNSFNGLVASNRVVVATYMDIQGTNVARRLRRVMLHNGLWPSAYGTTGVT